MFEWKCSYKFRLKRQRPHERYAWSRGYGMGSKIYNWLLRSYLEFISGLKILTFGHFSALNKAFYYLFSSLFSNRAHWRKFVFGEFCVQLSMIDKYLCRHNIIVLISVPTFCSPSSGTSSECWLVNRQSDIETEINDI